MNLRQRYYLYDYCIYFYVGFEILWYIKSISKTWIWKVTPFIFFPVIIVWFLLLITCSRISRQIRSFKGFIVRIIFVILFIEIGVMGSSFIFSQITVKEIRAKQEEFRAAPLYQADLNKIVFGADELTPVEQEIHRKVLLEVTDEKTKSRVVGELMNKQKRLREMDKNMEEYIEERVSLTEAISKDLS